MSLRYSDLLAVTIRRHNPYNNTPAEDDLPLYQHPAWHQDAACRGAMTLEDPADVTWFPISRITDPAGIRARQICSTCPVRAECFTWSFEQEPSLEGIWAGLDEKDRRAYRLANGRRTPSLEEFDEVQRLREARNARRRARRNANQNTKRRAQRMAVAS